MTAVASRRKTLSSVTLREDWHRGSGTRLTVDRERCVIHRIKILGWESENGRHYLPEAGRQALDLYEGAKCYSNHPPKGGATATRLNDDALGIWHNPDWQADGVYADLHYLKTHPMAERVCEDAERGLGLFGASHNADGKVEVRSGKPTVVAIGEVRSVDIVNDPATVSNLWEGRIADKPEKVKVSKVLTEKVLPSLYGHRKDLLESLLEAGISDKLLMEDDAAGDDAGDHKDHLYRAMRACEDAGDAEMGGKIHKLLAPPKEETPEADEGEPGDDAGKGSATPADDKPKTEGRKAKKPAVGTITVTETKLTEARAKRLCKLAGIEPTAEVLEAVIGLPEEKAESVLLLAKGKTPPLDKTRGAPRSQAPGRTQSMQESKIPQTAEDQATLLLR